MQKKKGWKRIKVDQNKWSIYLNSLEGCPIGLSEEHACSVREVWAKLTEAVGTIDEEFGPLKLPIAGPGGDNGFQMAWNTKRYYLDIDIGKDGEFEWFFIDRDTGEEYGSEDDAPIKEPPEKLLELLKKVCCEED